MFDHLVERLINEAQQRGAFEGLEGQGEPLAILAEPYDEMWWIKRFIDREHLHFLPAAQNVLQPSQTNLEDILSLRSEAEVRRRVAAVNRYLAKYEGPCRAKPLRAEAVVREWRTRRRMRREAS